MVDELTVGDVSALVFFQATLAAPTVFVPEEEIWRQAAVLGEARFDEFGCSACHVQALPLSSTVFDDPSPFDQAGTLRAGEVATAVTFDLALLEWMQDLERDENGDILVPLFGDLKRHRIADGDVAVLGNELLSQRFVEPDVFITAELWGVGTTAPYGHRNDLTTLDEVIRAHGGEARSARDLYLDAGEADRQAIIAFLRTLVIVP
jgi:cytochrome c peroxidase